jgi:hypothetical protein
MSDTRRQVLDMLSSGKITADEAERLIAALDRDKPSSSATNGTSSNSAQPKYLRVMADVKDDQEGPIKVNVRVPLQLLRAGVRLSSLIPTQAQGPLNEALHKEGLSVDLSQIRPENLEELIDQLKDLTVDVDSQSENLKVRVFCE